MTGEANSYVIKYEDLCIADSIGAGSLVVLYYRVSKIRQYFEGVGGMKIDYHGEVTSVLGEVSLGDFSMSVYIFYIDGMLVDTGASRMLEGFKAFYKETPIDLVSISHPHEDHTGTAQWLQRELGLPIYIYIKGSDFGVYG